MKTFNEFKNPPRVEKLEVHNLNEAQLKEVEALEKKLTDIVDKEGVSGLSKALDEGLLGGVIGFLAGPAIGKVIAHALGVEKGILYDMFTSRLVSAALGSAIGNNLTK